MSKTPTPGDDDARSALTNAVGIAIAFMLALILVSFTVGPSLSTAHQELLNGLIGSFAGSVLAFLLAVYLWRIERKVLIAERTQDRLEAHRSERERNDKNLLRECLAAVNQLRALEYSSRNEDRHSTVREKYFLELRISQSISLIADKTLREETRFIDSLTGDERELDFWVKPRLVRLRTAADWFGRLVSLDTDTEALEARPDDYPELHKSMKEYDEEMTERWEAYYEWERKERERMAKEKRTPGSADATSSTLEE